jgi:Arc/MetJ family transcription regulator
MHTIFVDNPYRHCIICIIGGIVMRTTLNLPDQLINEAMELTHEKTKTGVIKIALRNLIEKEKIKDLKKYFGKVDLDIDLAALRKR